MSWQPTPRLSQSIGYRRVDFRRADTRARVDDLDLANTRTTFQFTKQFFIRAIAQYDSRRARVLTDLLASYERQPGTVAFAGYGSLYERRAFLGDEWVSGEGEYLTTRRGFFLKASYLYRFQSGVISALAVSRAGVQRRAFFSSFTARSRSTTLSKP